MSCVPSGGSPRPAGDKYLYVTSSNNSQNEGNDPPFPRYPQVTQFPRNSLRHVSYVSPDLCKFTEKWGRKISETSFQHQTEGTLEPERRRRNNRHNQGPLQLLVTCNSSTSLMEDPGCCTSVGFVEFLIDSLIRVVLCSWLSPPVSCETSFKSL